MRSALVLLALLQLCAAIGGVYSQPVSAPVAGPAACAAGLTAALAKSAGSNVSVASPTAFIDADTPASACTRSVCTSTVHAACVADNPPQTLMQLVFSDEFNQAGRNFSYDKDSRWLAVDMYYAPTADKEVFKPDQVTTNGGAAVLTLDKAPENATASAQDPFGAIVNVMRPYVSGMLQSWNKFCFTGGYVEASIKLPGNASSSGFWPAFWMMGNLGRAGLLNTTGGLWPYSYDECEGSGPSGFDSQPGQLINACPDRAGINRTAAWGFNKGQGRGAPEIDIMELMVNTSSSSKASDTRAHIVQTLQMAPISPNGTHWVDPKFYAANGVQDGAFFPAAATYFKTRVNPQWGPFSTPGQLPRPSSVYQDALSAVSDISPTYFTDFFKFGVDWAPGEYLRWYIDGVFTFEINKEALAARENALGQRVGQRQIPEEPMYLILNLALSDAWVAQDPDLQFPATLEVDYVRVYQDPANLRLGCSPPDFPTAQYIACNQKQYILNPEDASLITEKCLAAPAPALQPKDISASGRKLRL